jgi:hypothetical protein
MRPVHRWFSSANGLEAAKWCAVGLMWVNHLTLSTPWAAWGFAAARVCVPIFGVILLSRVAFYPDCLGRVILRLIKWGLASQAVYGVYNQTFQLNILLVFALGLVLAYGWRRGWRVAVAVMLLGLLSCSSFLEYGAALPWVLVVGSGLVLQYPAGVAVLLCGVSGWDCHAWWGFAAALASIPLLNMSGRFSCRRLPGWVFYAAYPGSYCGAALVMWWANHVPR